MSPAARFVAFVAISTRWVKLPDCNAAQGRWGKDRCDRVIESRVMRLAAFSGRVRGGPLSLISSRMRSPIYDEYLSARANNWPKTRYRPLHHRADWT
jgi:hypothetical protein